MGGGTPWLSRDRDSRDKESDCGAEGNGENDAGEDGGEGDDDDDEEEDLDEEIDGIGLVERKRRLERRLQAPE